MRRRRFLIGVGSGLVATIPSLSSLLAGCTAPRGNVTAPPPGVGYLEWSTMAAVQAHLFPSEPNAPGAREIHAEAFLRGVFSDSRLAHPDREFLIRGAAMLARLARDESGARFIDLSGGQRESILRRFESMPEGRRWLEEILGYLLEALLGDPVYGGNPGGIGWRWLDHTPGFPRPPAHKRYFRL